MCGIVGYTGKRTAAPVVLEGLKRLEYRGYDSAGLAVVNGGLEIFRAPGKIAVLERELGSKLPEGTTAIAHTRWATHGAPTTANAHPHADCGGTIALVHNGIIENAGALRLAQRSCVFDDAVMDQGDGAATIGVRVGVRGGGGAVCRPTGVGDGRRAFGQLAAKLALEHGDLAGSAKDFEPAIDDGQTGGVIAAILEALQTLEHHR